MKKVFIVLIILILLVVLGIGQRIISYRKLRHQIENSKIQTVTVIQGQPAPEFEEMIIPGTVQAWHEADIYARTNGYTINWLVDIGSHVKKNQLLATISTPELDKQLKQAEADLRTAKANHQIAKITAIRWKNLVKTASVSVQEAEEKISTEQATAAIVSSARANRERLKKLVNFEKVIAPFSGVISLRNIDIGRLINEGAVNLPLFKIVQPNPLRIYVQVPEYYSSRLTSQFTADIYFREHPGIKFSGKLLNTAQAIAPTSRTLLTQFLVNNPQQELLAGSYVEAHFKLPNDPHTVYLPVNTLIFRSQGMQVATVDSNHKIALKSIVIERDFGDKVEVTSGINKGEWIVSNPPSTLVEGQAVRIKVKND